MNHVMTAVEDLRGAQVAETKRRIARAAIDVIVRDGAAALSYPAVAEQAGVSLRTVYRHFPNKEALVDGAVNAGSERSLEAFPPEEVRVSTMRPFLTALWAELSEQRDVVRVQHATPAGIEVRGQRIRARRELVQHSLERDYPDLPVEDLARLSDLLSGLMGSALLYDLVDHLGVSTADAAVLVAYAIEAVTERARREGGIR